MEKEPKKHHYVPRSVLRSFSISGGRRSVYVFDKSNGRVFPSTVGNAAAENHFYRVEFGKHKISFEPIFQELDDRLANLVARLTTTPSLAALDSADRHDLAVVTACQLLRTKIQRTSPVEIARQFLQRLERAGFEVPDEAVDEQRIRLESVRRLLALDEVAALLADKDLVLVKTRSSVLWTSDNPVVLHNTFPYGRPALSAPGVEVYHPIAPNLCLAFICRSLGEILAESLDPRHPRPASEDPLMEQLLCSIRDDVPLEGGDNFATYINQLQVSNSLRFLYGSGDDFGLANEILTRKPALRDVRSLVTVGELGKLLVPNPDMPPGTWLVAESGYRHHMLPVALIDDDSWAFAFTTTDESKLSFMERDSPFDSVTLYADGHARQMIRSVVFQHMERRRLRYVRVQQADPNRNALEEQIHRSRP